MTRIPRKIAIFFIFLLVYLVLFEAAARIFIKPSDKCYGILFKAELPPFRLALIDRGTGKKDYDDWYGKLEVNGKRITKGDLWGILQDDEELGCVPRENTRSFNGWWQSNNLGARSRTDTSREIPPGMQRVIIFGASNTNCSRVPQEETWPFFLNKESKGVEFVNFGVDGYGMGQCLLRYRLLKDKLDYDIVMLVFAPSAELDINVLRQFMGWQSYCPLPRFIIEGGKLKLIESPYKTWDVFYRDNSRGFSGRLKNHLRAYDRLYFRAKYESPPFIGRSIFYKLLARKVYISREKALSDNCLKTDSEAMTVSRKIFETIDEEARRDGKKFVLVCLPSAGYVAKFVKEDPYRRQYNDMVSSISREGIMCIDLTKDLAKIPPKQIDKGYDGTHYGPEANKMISGFLLGNLKKLGLIMDGPKQ